MRSFFAPLTAVVALLSGGSAPPPPSDPLVYRGTDTNIMTTAEVTSAAIDIGDAAADRRVFAVVWAFATSAAFFSCEIGGVAADFHGGVSGTSSRLFALYSAIVPTGTTATVKTTLTAAGQRYKVAVYTEHGSTSSTPHDTTTVNSVTASASGLPAGGLDIPAGGFGIFVNWHNHSTAGGETTWTIGSGTITEDVDGQANGVQWCSCAHSFDEQAAQTATATNAQSVLNQTFGVSWPH